MSSNRLRFSSTESSRWEEAIPAKRSSRIWRKDQNTAFRERYEKVNLLLGSIVCISFARFNKFDSEIIQCIEVVGSVSHDVPANVKESKILQNCVLEFRLPAYVSVSVITLREANTYSLFCRIGIIETDDELSVIHFCKILIQDSSLRVADMQIATWFGWEARNDLSIDGILQAKSESSGSFIGSGFGGLCCCEFGEHTLSLFQSVQIREPSQKVRMLVVFEETEDFNTPCRRYQYLHIIGDHDTATFQSTPDDPICCCN